MVLDINRNEEKAHETKALLTENIASFNKQKSVDNY